MVPGEAGVSGLHVPRPAEMELRPERDCVTVQPRHTVELTVRVMAGNRDSVTLGPALYQVNCFNTII